MMIETKRDVFDKLLSEYVDDELRIDGLVYEPDQHIPELDREYFINSYAAALPDDLPVIPKAWGYTIKEFKDNHYRLSEIFTEWDWNYDEQELIARAWVLGVWRVEETGEIVKLEAEK